MHDKFTQEAIHDEKKDHGTAAGTGQLGGDQYAERYADVEVLCEESLNG